MAAVRDTQTVLCPPDQETRPLLTQRHGKMGGKRRLHDKILSFLGHQAKDEQRGVLSLNVQLLGDRQSGRSSVGNALIGGNEFRTGTCVSGVSMTPEVRALSRRFPAYFRRRGAESDLLLRVLDTPAVELRPQSLQELCPQGVHVVVVVARADQAHENSQLLRHIESLFAPGWRRHVMLVFTHVDRLEELGLQPSVYLGQRSDWLGSLAKEVVGGASFLDNTCDWPSVNGRPLREKLLRLSATNHHQTLRFRSEQ